VTEFEIKIVSIEQADLQNYGQKITISNRKHIDSSSPGWDSWFPVGVIDAAVGNQFGIVRTQLVKQVIEMEMHPYRQEYVFSIDKPIVITMALSHKKQNAPDPKTVKAVCIYPSEGMKIFAGVWHGVGIPLGKTSTNYLFILAKPSKKDLKKEVGWTKFVGNAKIILKE